MNYNLLKTFIKVAELGSFTKAARQLKQPKSRVSRSIARLEEDLGTELVRRSTRSTSLTETGKNLYQETQGLMSQLESKVELIGSSSEEISGVLSISAPIDFGENIMPRLLCEFSQVHPKVTFEILLSDSYVNMTAQNIDIALRIGNLKDSAFKHKKLIDTQLILVASAEYISLKGLPKKWEDLSSLNVLSFYNENLQDPLEQYYQMYGLLPAVRANSFPMLKRLILESKGIGLLPNTICREEIKSGLLTRVLPKWGHNKAPMQVVFSSSRNLHPRTRAFIDFISEKNEELL